MSTKICPHCQQLFSGEDEICESCKFIKAKKIEELADLAGTIETLAILRAVKDDNNKDFT
ncbi:hypothetical protein [Paratissierella segnis]|jgi:predicted house-cleaning noncanonical NTP pyrophosphatase (MazG superfamily)|uniref:Uncharacterized protein n=1 Tax=Paratissierella segnis TaxID=2763679 RepID=A0A926EXN0_9FIRM|nr:hypothetical protein [Paratissierella segnis]MBC8588289.1 hypothetical protein [Paratissierella segnis]